MISIRYACDNQVTMIKASIQKSQRRLNGFKKEMNQSLGRMENNSTNIK
jgi:hypothetical protein